MVITDSGVHVWRAAGPDRPWQPGREPHLPTPIGYDDLSAMMAEAGVDRAILVPPSWEGERIDYSLEAAAKYPDRFAVMGRIPIEQPQAREMLETWKSHPGMLGVRLTFHHAWDRPWMSDGTADWFWPAAERLGIPVMLNAPTLQAEIAEIAVRHPGLRLILDHMGRVKGMRDATLAEAVEQTLPLAKHPNVYVKLTADSGMLVAALPLQEHAALCPAPHRGVRAAACVLGHRSVGDAVAHHLHLPAGGDDVHRGDEVPVGRRSRLDHGPRARRMPFVAGEVSLN